MPNLLTDWIGTIANTFQIGNSQAGSKALRFKNSTGALDLVANPTANATITLPNYSGRIITHIDDYYNLNFVAADHFLGGLTDWFNNSTGTSAAANVGTVSDPGGHPGICQCTTGTTATGRGGVSTGANGSIQLATSSSNAYFRADIRVPNLSDATNTFGIWIGLASNVNGSSDGNFIYFRYTHSTNSGNWQCVTRQNSGTESVVNTSTALPSNAWQTLQFIYDSSSANVIFYIDGTQVAVINTNIPTTSGQTLQGNAYITKSVGTTARTLEIDYIYLGINLF